MGDYQNKDVQAVNLGLNLRDAPDKLQEGQWRRLTNVRSFSEGSITARPGRLWVAGANTNDDVHTLFKLEDVIVSGQGSSVYRNSSLYAADSAGSLLGWTGRPLSWVLHGGATGDQRWAYVTDGLHMRLLGADGSVIKWGITAPIYPAVATNAGPGNLDSGAAGAIVYDWRYTGYNSRTGAESNPSPVQSGVAFNAHKAKVEMRSILDAQVDTLRLYRRGGVNGGTVWRLVGTAANPGRDPITGQAVSVFFEDNFADATIALSEALKLDNFVPFTTQNQAGDALYEAPVRYIFGPLDGKYIFGCGDPARPNHVYWTNAGRPSSSDVGNHIAVCGADEPLIGGFVYGGQAYVWSRQALYALDYGGPDAVPEFTPRKTFCGRGLSIPFAFGTGPLIWFFSKDGIYVTDGQSPAEPFSEQTIRPLFNPQVEDRLDLVLGGPQAIQWGDFVLAPPTTVIEAATSDTTHDFSVAVSNVSPSVQIGSSTTIGITVTPIGQYWGEVAFSLTPIGLPPGVSYSFSPSSVVPGGGVASSVLTISTVATAAAGSATFQVVGKRVNGTTTHSSEVVTLTIAPGVPPPPPPPPTNSFDISVLPTMSVAQGGSGTGSITATITGTYTGTPTLSTINLNAGITVNFSAATISPPGSATFTITTSSTLALGTYTVTIKAADSTVTRTRNITLTVTTATYTITPSPAAVTVAQDGVGYVSVAVERTGTSFSSVVTLASSSNTTGVDATLTQTQVQLPTSPIMLVLTAARIAALGNATITISGTATVGTATVAVSTTITVKVVSNIDPVPVDAPESVLRLSYGGQELHVHYRDITGGWVHLRNHLPYNRWSNDEALSVPTYGDVRECLTYFDEQQASTNLLIGTNTGLVALENGTYDYVENHKVQCRARTGSYDLSLPQTQKEFGNILLDVEVRDAVIPSTSTFLETLTEEADTAATSLPGIIIIPLLNAEQQALGFQRVLGAGNTTYRQKIPRTLSSSNAGQDPYGFSIAFDLAWDGRATVYAFTLQWRPDEEKLTRWEAPPTTHGLRGWQQVRDVYFMLKSGTGSSTVTPLVEVDGISYALTSDLNTATATLTNEKRLFHFWAPPVKGKVYRWILTGTQFIIYPNECQVNAKPFNTGQAYQLVNPFSGGD